MELNDEGVEGEQARDEKYNERTRSPEIAGNWGERRIQQLVERHEQLVHDEDNRVEKRHGDSELEVSTFGERCLVPAEHEQIRQSVPPRQSSENGREEVCNDETVEESDYYPCYFRRDYRTDHEREVDCPRTKC